MTAIAGIVDKDTGVVYIGGDSAGAGDHHVLVRDTPKVFKRMVMGDWMVFGFTSSFRFGQILEYCFEPPELTTGFGLTYMVSAFIPALRNTLNREYWLKTRDGVAEQGAFMIGYKSRLFGVECDFSVFPTIHGYHACGYGADMIRSSLYTSGRVVPKIHCSDRIGIALASCAEFSRGIRPPFTILSTFRD